MESGPIPVKRRAPTDRGSLAWRMPKGTYSRVFVAQVRMRCRIYKRRLSGDEMRELSIKVRLAYQMAKELVVGNDCNSRTRRRKKRARRRVEFVSAGVEDVTVGESGLSLLRKIADETPVPPRADADLDDLPTDGYDIIDACPANQRDMVYAAGARLFYSDKHMPIRDAARRVELSNMLHQAGIFSKPVHISTFSASRRAPQNAFAAWCGQELPVPSDNNFERAILAPCPGRMMARD